MYKIYYTTKNKTEQEETIKIQVPNQKWNHFFFNYNGTNMDLYVNGILVRNVQFNNMPIYNLTDQVVIGSTIQSGLNGAICEVIYYNTTISPFQIANIYNIGNSYM